jgi:hypothetical protein
MALDKKWIETRLNEILKLLPESAAVISMATRYGTSADVQRQILKARQLLEQLRAEL